MVERGRRGKSGAVFKECRSSGVDGNGLNDYSHLLESQGNVSGFFTASWLRRGNQGRGRGLWWLGLDSGEESSSDIVGRSN